MQCYKTWVYGIWVLTSGIGLVYNALNSAAAAYQTEAHFNY